MTTTRSRITLLTAALALAAAACGSAGSSNDAGPVAARPTSSVEPEAATTTVAADRSAEPLDRLVPIDHGNVHLRCTGDGPVTVLMLAGWDMGADAWGPFEADVAEHTRACAYDRFGTGTSDAPAENQTFATQVADLHAALEVAGEPGPYVVVGHSFGGPEAVTFASTFEDEVIGVVLVDAPPDTWPSVVCTVPAYQGGCDLMRAPERDVERLDVFPAFEQVSEITSLGALPLTVISAAHRNPEGLTAEERADLDEKWASGQQRWATRSTSSKVVTVDGTGHDIHLDQPQAVLDEIIGLLP